MLQKLQNSRNALGLLFMLPAAVLLVLFLTYPLILGVWLGFTDTKIGRSGSWIGLENYQFLLGDSVTQLALFNTLFYTFVASVLKFVLGLWLAILLNENIPFKTFFRTVIFASLYRSYCAFCDSLLVDLRCAILRCELGPGEGWNHRPLHRFSGQSLECTPVDHSRQHLARRSVCGHYFTGGSANNFSVALRGSSD